MADPTALQTAVAAAQAVQLIGMPEARIILADAVVHLATAPEVRRRLQRDQRGHRRRPRRPRPGDSGPPARRPLPGGRAAGHGKGYVIRPRRAARCRPPAVPAGRPGRPELLRTHGQRCRTRRRGAPRTAAQDHPRRLAGRPGARMDLWLASRPPLLRKHNTLAGARGRAVVAGERLPLTLPPGGQSISKPPNRKGHPWLTTPVPAARSAFRVPSASPLLPRPKVHGAPPVRPRPARPCP